MEDSIEDDLTEDEMARRLIKLVITSNCPQDFCGNVRKFCDDLDCNEFKLELLKRRLSR